MKVNRDLILALQITIIAIMDLMTADMTIAVGIIAVGIITMVGIMDPEDPIIVVSHANIGIHIMIATVADAAKTGLQIEAVLLLATLGILITAAILARTNAAMIPAAHLAIMGAMTVIHLAAINILPSLNDSGFIARVFLFN